MKRSINFSSSPLLTSATPVWRSRLIVGGFALAFVVLVGRAAYVQIIGNDFYKQQGEVRFARTLDLPPNRGRILDRNGLILAASVVAQSVWAIPVDVDTTDAKLPQMAKLLGMSMTELRGLLDNDKTFTWIQRQVDEPVALQVRDLNIKGIHLRREYKRQYPEGESAAHVVGFTNIDDKGQEGIELAFHQQLSGQAGSRRVIKDRLGRVIEDVREAIQPIDGQDIQLSIDSKVQYLTYQRLREAVIEHKAQGGSAVVLDAKTGEVLALANYPSYNPSDRRTLAGGRLRNRALTDSFEPGSTVKPIMAALALEIGMAHPDTVIETGNGRMTMGRFTISDIRSFGPLTLTEVIQKSSNVGTVKLAMQMQPRDMWQSYYQTGFGQRPQLPFPGAVAGRLRDYTTWRPVEQATMSYGYGLSSSLFQLAQAYTVFSSDGLLLPVTLLKTDQPVTGQPVFAAQHAVAVRHMLSLATGPGGTAQRAQTPGYSVGGKTGTTRKHDGRGYAEGKYRSFFVGIAPIDAPRIVVAVMIDEPNNGHIFGGAVAAPVFSDTVQHTLRVLRVQPDITVKPHIVKADVEEVL